MQYHVDGRLVDRERATVSVEDRGFRYGDAAFETCRAYGGEVFRWKRHVERLGATCETLGMPDAVPHDLPIRVAETLEANGLEDAYVRISVTRGVQPGKLTPRKTVDPTVVVIVKPLPRGGVDGESVWGAPAVVQSVQTRRPPDSALPTDAKTHNYLNGILARLELRRATTEEYRPDEALLRDIDGYVAEGTTSNLFFVDEDGLHTPTTEGSVLPGITRRVVLELAEETGVPVHEGWYRSDDIREADEVFLTNTTWEVRPVDIVDGIAFEGDDGAVTTLLSRLFDQRVEQSCYVP